MSENSKKHHFNPEHILHNFVLGGEKKLYVFDKYRGQSFSDTPRNTGHENHFNSVTVGDERINLEPVFQDADSRQSMLMRKIIAHREIKSLTISERVDLAELVVLQWLRVKIIRNNIRELPKLLKQVFGDLGIDDSVAPEIEENEAKLQSFEMLADSNQYVPFVLGKQWSLVFPPEGSWFWTSDNPICITNGFASGEPGLASQGSKISWPIAKDLMLQFACPSISNKIETFDQRAATYLRSEPTMICSSEHVEQFNFNQLINSTRFVYAPDNDFAAAKRFLESHPGAKSQGALIRRIQCGDHPDSLDYTLVINGESTIHEIPFESWEDRGSHLFVRVAEGAVEKLGRAISDVPHSALTINNSLNGGCGMRDIELVQSDSDPREVSIRHSNPVLAAIMGNRNR